MREVLGAAIEREGSSFDGFYRTPEGRPGSYQHLFQVYGQADSFSPTATQQAFAMAASLGLVAPDASVAKPDDIWGQPTNPPPFSGNLSTGDKTFTGTISEIASSVALISLQ